MAKGCDVRKNNLGESNVDDKYDVEYRGTIDSDADSNKNKAKQKVLQENEPTMDVDRGWAWFVLLSAFLMHLIVMGVNRSLGIFVEEFQDRFQVETREVGVVTGIAVMLVFGTGLVVHILVVRFSARRVVIAGSLLSSAGLIATAFVSSFGWVYVTYGLVTGIGCGLSFNPPCVLLGQSFDKYRAIAYGIAVSGAGLGAFIIPNICRALIKEYSLEGCLFILGALTLNVSVCGFLLPSRRGHEDDKRRHTLSKMDDLKSPRIIMKSDSNELTELAPRTEKPREEPPRKSPSPILDWSLLARPTFLLHLTSAFFSFMANVNNLFMVAPFATANGHSRDSAALILSILGAADLSSRLTFPVITSHVLKFRRRILLAGCVTVTGPNKVPATARRDDLHSLITITVSPAA